MFVSHFVFGNPNLLHWIGHDEGPERWPESLQ